MSLSQLTKSIIFQRGGEKPPTSYDIEIYTGWWFGTFFIFPYIGNNNPINLTNIFQRG